NDNAPGQKPVLPFRRHVAQDARIDDGVIKGKRYFQNAENRTDDEDGDHSPKSAGHFVTEPDGTCETQYGKNHGPDKIAKSGHCKPSDYYCYQTETGNGHRATNPRSEARFPHPFYLTTALPAKAYRLCK